MRKKKQLIVIGNGMIGFKFCELLAEKNAGDVYDITVFGEENLPAYDRVHLSEYFSESTVEKLILQPKEWYSERNIRLILGDRVTKIDRDKKNILSENGLKENYDKLILATGSSPFVPPIPGVDKEGVFVYRTIDDMERILGYSKNVQSVAVIGGGLLGLEAAKAILDLKLDTHVVEFAPLLMPRQLDAKGSALLKNKIEKLGIHVHLDTATREIAGNGSVVGLEFNDETKIDVEMIVISAGIKPRDELGKESGLELGERGGFIVNNRMQTSDSDIYAIGECALHEGMIYGLVAPGHRMAETACENILERKMEFLGADMSSKLKLLGVDVASFGNPIQDENGYAVTLEDESNETYKKLIISKEGNHLQGGILLGDASDYGRLLSMYQAETPVPSAPETLLFSQQSTSDQKNALRAAYLPSSAVVCSCNNMTKGDIVKAITEQNITDLSKLKQATKAGTGCGGCVPLMKDILTLEMENVGVKVDQSLCEHFSYKREKLLSLIRVDKLRTFPQILKKYGTGHGCEICKPAIASILAGLWNDPILNHQEIQETNDYLLANIQKNGSYSVIPRSSGGEISPEQLITIAETAKDFQLYTKITGGQRIALFGAKAEDLPKIWKHLKAAGLESGRAYGKSLRNVKSCIGQRWCRFGVQDSVGLAIELENRYKGIRSPHKMKGGVSGCIRECAEARGKDFGVIATEKGWNIYVCGNGGAKPQHAVLLAENIEKDLVIKYLDRFLMYYIRTADHINRTSVWLNKMEGGIGHLKDVVINDSLGIANDLEKQMQHIVDTYECEWANTLKRPTILKKFSPALDLEKVNHD